MTDNAPPRLLALVLLVLPLEVVHADPVVAHTHDWSRE